MESVIEQAFLMFDLTAASPIELWQIAADWIEERGGNQMDAAAMRRGKFTPQPGDEDGDGYSEDCVSQSDYGIGIGVVYGNGQGHCYGHDEFLRDGSGTGKGSGDGNGRG